MFLRWDSHEFSTDWGTRDVGEHERIYDPISYHQGSVWPLFTGWASIADYRTGHTLSGYAHLKQNADLTYQQDLGAVTELLSGAYFVPFGRSTTHQMWSSAMVVTPLVRGLFGITRDATTHELIVDPHLPAEWDHAAVHNLSVGGQVVNLDMHRETTALVVRMTPAGKSSQAILLSSKDGIKAAQQPGGVAELRIPLPEIEVGIPTGLPLPAASTAQIKVISETRDSHSITLQLEAQGGETWDLPLRFNGPTGTGPRVDGATIAPWSGAAPAGPAMRILRVPFPVGKGYRSTTVRLTW
jgi:hypothetical protein